MFRYASSEMAVTSAPVSNLKFVSWSFSFKVANHAELCFVVTMSRKAVSSRLSLVTAETCLVRH